MPGRYRTGYRAQTYLIGSFVAARFARGKRDEDDEKDPEDEEIRDHGSIENLEERPVKAEKAEDKDEYPYFRVFHAVTSGFIITESPLLCQAERGSSDMSGGVDTPGGMTGQAAN